MTSSSTLGTSYSSGGSSSVGGGTSSAGSSMSAASQVFKFKEFKLMISLSEYNVVEKNFRNEKHNIGF